MGISVFKKENQTIEIGQSLIHQVFEEKAKQYPNRIAVVFENQQMTYEELNKRSNQLAHRLRSLGVGPNKLVGICVDRSLEIMVGVLGVLKAGGTYVPLDYRFPKDRLLYMMENSNLSVLLTKQTLVSNLPALAVKKICLDVFEEYDRESTENPTNITKNEDLAYVIYTSGSTGRPKGVMVEHRNLMHYVSSIIPALKLEEGMNFATVSTLAADLGNTSIFPSLCLGGTLHILSMERITDSHALAEYLSRNPVDCLKIVPSHLSALLGTNPEMVLPKKGLFLEEKPFTGI